MSVFDQLFGPTPAEQAGANAAQLPLTKATPDQVIQRGMESVKWGLRMSRDEAEAERIIAQIEILLNS